LPEDLLYAQRVERPQSDPYERRILRDGTVRELTSVSAHVEDGEMQFEQVPLEWRELATVGPDGVRLLEDAIRSADVVSMPAEQAPEGTSIGGSIVTITVGIDGREHTVRLLGLNPAEVPGIADVDRIAQVVVGQALHPE
jgi:hypothetical protein